MGKPMFICPKGHYSIVGPEMFSVSPHEIVIDCSVCHELTFVPCQTMTGGEKPKCAHIDPASRGS